MSDGPIRKDDQAVLEAARSGDPDAFEQLIAKHRPSLHAHSYRILGSRQDADDAIQEALLRAWRAIPRFEGRSSVRTWLYRIATNASLDLIARRRRRAAPLESEPAGNPAAGVTEVPLTDDTRPEPHPDDQLMPQDRYERREAVELAFSAALRHLPSRPRAALILRDVLGFRAREAAEVLSTSPAAVNSALQRARAALENGNLDPTLQATRPEIEGPSPAGTAERFVDALERDDLEAIVESLRTEVRRRERT
jgi:RNA polymerase sigma-70 factor (ECF subfamily)